MAVLLECEATDGSDIYFETRYAEIYNEIEGGTCRTVKYTSEYGTAMTTFIKRPVPINIGTRQYYDIITPYGFGGPVIVESSNDGLLAEGFVEAFREYCMRGDIICEFVRFHPLLNNVRGWLGTYDVQMNRKMIAIGLRQPDFRAQFKHNCRNNIRRALNCGVRAELDTSLETMEDFVELYYKTMQKNNADPYYFFPKAYFERFANNLRGNACIVNARLDDQTISAALFMYSPRYAHCHLSATLPECYKYEGNNLVLDKACEHFQGIRCEWLLLGGGVTADEADPLFVFKHTFGRTEANVKEFFTGRKVWNPEVYQKVMESYLAAGYVRKAFFSGIPAVQGLREWGCHLSLTRSRRRRHAKTVGKGMPERPYFLRPFCGGFCPGTSGHADLRAFPS